MKKRKKRKLSEREKYLNEHPVVKKKIDETLKNSIKEGSYAAGTQGLGVSYLSPYAIALNASSSQIGFMNAIVSLVPSIVQIGSSKLIERFSRKKIAVISAFLQTLVFIPIILVSFLFLKSFEHTILILIILVGLFYGIGGITHPAWFSWMGSLVPEQSRGKYFSKRNVVTGFFGLIAMIIGAIVLDRFEKAGLILIGFGILFTMAFILRLISLVHLKKEYEPKIKVRKKDYFSLWSFIKNGRKTPFGRFTIFTAFMRIATNIAGPFFVVYLLRDLGLSYIWFMAITVSGTVFQLIFYPLIGKISDKFGNIQLLRLSCILIAFIPIFYIVSSNPFYLVTVPGIFSGFAWAGFNLATNNYIYDSLRPTKRTYGLSYFNLFMGVGLFIGAGVGSLLALMNITFMNKILFIFLISGVARLSVYYFGQKYLKEVRHVGHFSTQFIIKEFSPGQGIVRELHAMKDGFEKLEGAI